MGGRVSCPPCDSPLVQITPGSCTTEKVTFLAVGAALMSFTAFPFLGAQRLPGPHKSYPGICALATEFC